MPRRSKEITDEVKAIILDHKNKGGKVREITELVNIPKSTVQDIITRIRERGTHSTASRTGRPRKTTPADDRKIIQQVLKNSKLLAKEVLNTLPEDLVTTLSTQTVRNRIRETGFRGCTARWTPSEAKSNIKKGLHGLKSTSPSPKRSGKILFGQTNVNLTFLGLIRSRKSGESRAKSIKWNVLFLQ